MKAVSVVHNHYYLELGHQTLISTLFWADPSFQQVELGQEKKLRAIIDQFSSSDLMTFNLYVNFRSGFEDSYPNSSYLNTLT